MKTAQDIAQRVTEEARIKMKTVYDRKARAPKICVGDKVLVKILKFEGKHKIEDRYEDDIYTVVGQPNIQIPVFDVRSENGTEKRLHRNHLFLLGFIDNRTEDEDKGDGDDGQKEDGNSESQGKEDRKDDEKGKTAAVADDQSTDLDPEIKDDSKKDHSEKNRNLENTVQTGDNEYSDEDDDDSEIEFVAQTHPTGDAWTSGSHLTHDKGPVQPEKNKDLTEEKDKEKKTEETDTDITKSEVVHTAADTKEEEVDVNLETDPHTDETREAEAEEEKGATGGALPRRSTREKTKPKRFESYVMHQVTSRPVDRRLQTLQSLLGSGVFNQLDSDMTTSILDAVMK